MARNENKDKQTKSARSEKEYKESRSARFERGRDRDREYQSGIDDYDDRDYL
jgi:hypothetical protein